LARGGPDDVANICCACVTCNSRKGDKLPHQFTGQLELFSVAA
jgi:5-methylcytosine-specific restriction endonuclease McrA